MKKKEDIIPAIIADSTTEAVANPESE